MEISKHLITDPEAKLNLEEFKAKYEKDYKHWHSLRQGLIDCREKESEDATFRPMINQKSKQLAKDLERIEKRMNTIGESKRKKIEELQKE